MKSANLLCPLTVIFVVVSVSFAEDRCTNSSCVPPFSHCSESRGTCEAIKRALVSDDFLPHPYSISWDKQVDVVCNEDGYYPFSDCYSFYHCQDGKATLKTCNSPGYPFFDPVKQRCSNRQDCPRFDCYNKPGLKVGLQGRLSSFFAYCFRAETFYSMSISRDANIHLISRCYGKDIFNSNTGWCEPRCVDEGVIPDISDCHSYFLCSLKDPVNNVFTMTKVTCPEGQGFLSNQFRCVPQQILSSCNQTRARPV